MTLHSALTGTDLHDPKAHAASHHTGGTDPLDAADIGAADATHTHAESDVTDLTTDLAKLPPAGGSTGDVLTKASSSDFDMGWAASAGGGASDTVTVYNLSSGTTWPVGTAMGVNTGSAPTGQIPAFRQTVSDDGPVLGLVVGSPIAPHTDGTVQTGGVFGPFDLSGTSLNPGDWVYVDDNGLPCDQATALGLGTFLHLIGICLANGVSGMIHLSAAPKEQQYGGTVTDETAWGISPYFGNGTIPARNDHTHGSPPDPRILSEGLTFPLLSGSPTTPGSGTILVYAKASDGKVYRMNSSSVETLIG